MQRMHTARALGLTRWAALDLARAPTVGAAMIRRAEALMGEIALTFANPPIRGAFEIAGIEFIEDNDGGRKLEGRIVPVSGCVRLMRRIFVIFLPLPELAIETRG